MLPEGGESPPEAFDALLSSRCAAFDLTLEPPARAQLSRYLALLDLWRRRTNLTGPFPAESLVDHVLESALGADRLLLPRGARIADIGSGGGFPGIPIAILRPDVSLLPVEPRRKRREFLDLVSETLRLTNVAPAAPGLRGLPPAGLSGAVSRAVKDLAGILGEGEILEPFGVLLAWTTDPEALARELSDRFRLESVREVPGTERKKIALLRKSAARAASSRTSRKKGPGTDVPRGTRPGGLPGRSTLDSGSASMIELFWTSAKESAADGRAPH